MPIRFVCAGLDLARPFDLIKVGKYAILQNVRSTTAGAVERRPGLALLNTVVAGQSPTHSVRRLNDEAAASWTRIVGTGTHLAYGQTIFTSADSGYSSDPLTLVPWRPDQSPEAWMYVADRSRQRKIRRDGTVHNIGLATPLTAPTAVIGTPSYSVVDNFDATTGWAQGGTAGAPALLSAGPGYRIDTTITRILYDTGTTGWACVQPGAIAGIGKGAQIVFNPGGGTAETVSTEKVLPQITVTTVGSILFDSGSIGKCSIVLASAPAYLENDALILLNSGGATEEAVRVEEVVMSKDKVPAIRVTTVNTHVAGESITGLLSFRVRLANNHAAAEVLRSDGVRTALTTGTGTLTKTSALDLSGLGGRPIQPEDEIHLSLRFSSLAALTEGKIFFDVDVATNDFTRNYYYFAFRPGDLVSSAAGTQALITAKQLAQQREQVDTAYQPTREINDAYRYSGGFYGYPGPYPTRPPLPTSVGGGQVGLGDTAWLELRIRVSQLIRVGSDRSQTLRNVAALRVSFTVTAANNADLDSWWVGGTYGPDVGDIGEPYVYRYRARASLTGAKSGFSPAMRTGLLPHRQPVTVTLAQHAATECDKLDVFRWGGTLTAWFYVGTSANGATPTFTDTYPDDTLAVNPLADLDHYQPWLISDTPKTGTASSVVGTLVSDSGTTFNTAWAHGTLIRINGIAYTLYRVLSTSKLELFENAGGLTNVSWEVPEPKLMAQNLPSMWLSSTGFMFACGDDKNPGRLYHSKGNDPDATREGYYIEVTAPTEPLVAGCTYNGRDYVFSSERMFAIYPSFGEIAGTAGTILFNVVEVPNGRGLFSRWALAVGPSIWFLSRDGIYETNGGDSRSITADDLRPLFPHEGIAGASVNGVAAPDLSYATKLRLSYANNYLYFDYLDGSGVSQTLIYSLLSQGWFRDVYTPTLTFHHGEEGEGVNTVLGCGSNGKLYSFTTVGSDDTTAIACQVRTGAFDNGDPRQGKFYGDLLLDANTDSIDFSLTVGFDSYTATLGPFTVNTSSRARTQVDINSANGRYGYNVALDIAWSSASASPVLYFWEPSVEAAPDSLKKWITQPQTHGLQGYQHLRDAYVALISTAAVTLTVNVDGTDYTFTIASTGGERRKVYVPLTALKGKVFDYTLASSADFRLFKSDSEVRVKPWGHSGPYYIIRPFGDISEGVGYAGQQ